MVTARVMINNVTQKPMCARQTVNHRFRATGLYRRFLKTGHSTSNIVLGSGADLRFNWQVLISFFLVTFLIITLAVTMENQYPAVRPEILYREFIFWTLELLENLFAWWLRVSKVCKHEQKSWNFMKIHDFWWNLLL